MKRCTSACRVTKMNALIIISYICLIMCVPSEHFALSKKVDRREKYQSCGSGQCFCEKETAYCDGNKTQKTLPYINRTIKELYVKDYDLSIFSNDSMKEIWHLMLQKLYLTRNSIGNMSTEIFKHFHELTTIEVSGNQNINSSSLFLALERLSTSNVRSLFLSNNDLDYANFNVLGKIHSLEYLDLSNNYIRKLDMTLLADLKSLKCINLASNWIQTLTACAYPPVLEKIDLSDNHFTGFPPDFCHDIPENYTFPNIKHIDLSSNYLQRLDTKWGCLSGIETLSFNSNNVRLINNGVFSYFKRLKQLDLSNMTSYNVKYKHEAFESSSLQKLNLGKNWVKFANHEIQQVFRFCPNITWLDISHNRFSDMVAESITKLLSPMKRLEWLNMARTSLKHFPVELLENLTALEVLNIDNNLLHTMEFPPSFHDGTERLRIRNLSIAKGFITTLNKKSFPLRVMNSLRNLNLGDNQFACTCDMEWFRDQVNSSGYIGSVQLVGWPIKYVCKSPIALEGRPFMDFRPVTVCLNPVMISLLAIGTFLVMFSIISVTIYCKRWYIRYWWYKLNRHKRGDDWDDQERRTLLDKRFDGFVVADPEHEFFVNHSFRSMMESNLGYRLHIWKRNMKNGAAVDVILDAMYASKQTIIIVTNDLVKDSWCKFQVDVAIGRSIELQCKCVLLVILEDINYQNFSKSWCALYTKTPKAYWSDDKNSIKQKLFAETIRQHFGLPVPRTFSGL